MCFPLHLHENVSQIPLRQPLMEFPVLILITDTDHHCHTNFKTLQSYCFSSSYGKILNLHLFILNAYHYDS